jgi:hypothetical protein
MFKSTKPTPALTIVLVLVQGFVACASPDKNEPSARTPASGRKDAGGLDAASNAAPEALPWTDAFAEPAALLAAEVRIEGPTGLIAHVATVSDPEELERTEKTVPEGFLQVLSVKPQARGAEIKAQLDRLAIVALERLTILERPSPAAVVVLAKGDVYYAKLQTGEEKRSETLRLDGKIVR